MHSNDILLPNILLVPINKELGEVRIGTAKPKKRDSNRDRYLRMFIREFFGSSENAAQCKITNPDVLNFKYDDNIDKLLATASDYMIIENKALGYRIKYLLESFVANQTTTNTSYTGSFVFSDMDTTVTQKAIWMQKRTEAYLGSQMHFLRSCIANDMAGSGFTVYKLFRTPTEGRQPDSLINVKVKYFKNATTFRPELNDSLKYWNYQAGLPRFDQKLGAKPLPVPQFAGATTEKGIYKLFGNYLMVNYLHTDRNADNKSTFITFLTDATYFDSNGVIFTPLNCNIEGFWGTLRMADLLPVDYELPN